jgi:hypothetical protein
MLRGHVPHVTNNFSNTCSLKLLNIPAGWVSARRSKDVPGAIFDALVVLMAIRRGHED